VIAGGRGARLLIAAVLLTLTGCGVPSDGEARPVPLPSVPPESSAAPPDSTSAVAAVYLVGPGDRLQPVQRSVAAQSGLQVILDQLALGPTDAENAAGLRSVLTGTVGAATVIGGNAGPDGGAVVVQLSSQLAGLTGAEQLLGIGQIMVSLGAAGVERVEFVDASGNVLGVPLPDGTVSTGLVDPAAYQVLVA
jgi:hypothetical protein